MIVSYTYTLSPQLTRCILKLHQTLQTFSFLFLSPLKSPPTWQHPEIYFGPYLVDSVMWSGSCVTINGVTWPVSSVIRSDYFLRQRCNTFPNLCYVFQENGFYLLNKCFELDIWVQLEMLNIIAQILQDVFMRRKGRQVRWKWKIREEHNLFGKIGPTLKNYNFKYSNNQRRHTHITILPY